ATGTPPRGSASTTVSVSGLCCGARARASAAPASPRSENGVSSVCTASLPSSRPGPVVGREAGGAVSHLPWCAILPYREGECEKHRCVERRALESEGVTRQRDGRYGEVARYEDLSWTGRAEL